MGMTSINIPIHKMSGTLCHRCRVIISPGHTDDLFCSPCRDFPVWESRHLSETTCNSKHAADAYCPECRVALWLPADIARCNGVGDDAQGWREGCETCLRRTAPRPERVVMIDPPDLIAFECEYLIEP